MLHVHHDNLACIGAHAHVSTIMRDWVMVSAREGARRGGIEGHGRHYPVCRIALGLYCTPSDRVCAGWFLRLHCYALCLLCPSRKARRQVVTVDSSHSGTVLVDSNGDRLILKVGMINRLGQVSNIFSVCPQYRHCCRTRLDFKV